MNRQILRFPWVAATCGALLVAAGGLSLLRLPSPPRPEGWLKSLGERRPLQLGEVGDAEVGAALRDELVLQDPKPLFLPTEWNSGQAEAPAEVRLEPGTSFGPFGPKYAFAEDDARVVLPEVAQVPAGPLETVELISDRPVFRELARQDLELRPLPGRLAHVQVNEADGGAARLALEITELPEAEATMLRRETWGPAELLVAVGPAGLMGRPAFMMVSGSERIDNWVVEHLTGAARLGARLEPGFYRVVVGP